ncbi:MAG: hypothetical protein ABI411_10710 [Tahibacter sp.]
MNPSNDQLPESQALDSVAADEVGGGNDNSYNAGLQAGQALGGAYQSAVNYFSETVFPFYLD